MLVLDKALCQGRPRGRRRIHGGAVHARPRSEIPLRDSEGNASVEGVIFSQEAGCPHREEQWSGHSGFESLTTAPK